MFAELALVEAVRDTLIEAINLPPDSIDIQMDDIAPATAGQTYIAIQPSIIGPGSTTDKADQVIHFEIGCRVAVILRIGQIPRDRRRSIYLSRAQALSYPIRKAVESLHFQYAVINRANTIAAGDGDGGQFIKPLRFSGVDGKPRFSTADIFAGQAAESGADPIVAMIRGVNFRGAEYMIKRGIPG